MKTLRTFMLTCLVGFFAFTNAFAQPKTTDIWTADIEMRNGKPILSPPLRITSNDYYDNQPWFSADGMLLFYSSMPDTTQADIYEYNLRKKSYRQLTNTLESEYQPQLIPFDKKRLSIVRVDMDKAQRFYSISMLDGVASDPLMQNEDSLAYYCWINDTTVGAYMLNGQGGILEQYDMKPQQSIILMNNGGFGRCLARIPGTELMSYVQKSSDGSYILMQYDMQTEERTPITQLPEKTEDYAWAPDGKIYTGLKGKLLYFDTKSTDLKWVECADWIKAVGNFYRVVLSQDGTKIAIVSHSGDKP